MIFSVDAFVNVDNGLQKFNIEFSIFIAKLVVLNVVVLAKKSVGAKIWNRDYNEG